MFGVLGVVEDDAVEQAFSHADEVGEAFQVAGHVVTLLIEAGISDPDADLTGAALKAEQVQLLGLPQQTGGLA